MDAPSLRRLFKADGPVPGRLITSDHRFLLIGDRERENYQEDWVSRRSGRAIRQRGWSVFASSASPSYVADRHELLVLGLSSDAADFAPFPSARAALKALKPVFYPNQ